MRFWKEYYILGEINDWRFQIINNWHEFKREEWYLISVFRRFYNRDYSYFICFFGFQLRIFLSSKGRDKRTNKQ